MRKIAKKETKRIPEKFFSRMRKLIPILTIDGVILANGNVLLVRRSIKPYSGYWCVPGGRVEFGETVEEAVNREIKEETGLDVEIKKLIGIYSDFKRDPRGHTITIAYLLKAIGGELKRDEKEASDIKFFKILPKNIGFDHRKIVMDAKCVARSLKT